MKCYLKYFLRQICSSNTLKLDEMKICDALRDFGSFTIWRLHGRLVACECMLMLCSTFISFLSVCMSQHGIRTGLSNVKRLNAIQTGKHQQLMTFECCFLISQYHKNCNAMSSSTVLRHVPWNTFICSAVQCFHQFVMGFIYCLLSWFVLFTIFFQ